MLDFIEINEVTEFGFPAYPYKGQINTLDQHQPVLKVTDVRPVAKGQLLGSEAPSQDEHT